MEILRSEVVHVNAILHNNIYFNYYTINNIYESLKSKLQKSEMSINEEEPKKISTILIFKDLYGEYINDSIIKFTYQPLEISEEENKNIISSLGNTLIPQNGVVYLAKNGAGKFVSVNLSIDKNFAFGNSGKRLTLYDTKGILLKFLSLDDDMIAYDSNGKKLNNLPNLNDRTGGDIIYIYIQLRYEIKNRVFNELIDGNNARLNTSFRNSPVTDFIDYVIRTTPNVNPVVGNNENIANKDFIDNSYLNPQTPTTEPHSGTTKANNQYTPSPIMPVYVGVQQNTMNVNYYNTFDALASTTLALDANERGEFIEDDEEYSSDEFMNFSDIGKKNNVNTDIDSRSEPVNNNDVLQSELNLLNELSENVPFQPIDPDFFIQTQVINNPFANPALNNNNAPEEVLNYEIEDVIIPQEQQRILGDDEMTRQIREFMIAENLLPQLVKSDLPPPNNLYSGFNNFASYPPINPGDIPPAPPLPGGNGVGYAYAGFPNLGIYVPNAIRNKWVLLGITSAVIVGSFTFLTYLYSDSIKDKIASITSAFINKLRPTEEGSPVQLIQVDNNGVPVDALNTPQEVIDNYIQEIKLSPTLSAEEHMLIDPLLENTVVDTVIVKENDKARKFTYLNARETMSNIIKSKSKLFNGFLPNLNNEPPDDGIVGITSDGNEVGTKTSILNKITAVGTYMWNLIWFLLGKVIEILEKSVNAIISVSKSGFLLLLGAIALGIKLYMDRK